jgi:hypothetical protein
MQQFDPPGWAEVIFTHACMVARTMGLHHVQISPADTSAEEKLECAKVLRSLYAQDKSLCITRGTVSWLPSHDCNIASQLKAAVERQVPYSDRIALSMIQDDIYRLTHATYRRRPGSSSKSNATLQLIEQQLSEYANAFGIFERRAPYSPRHAMITLEFLATRIIALQRSSELGCAGQVRQDARASCLLLLMAHGEQDHKVIEAFNASTSQRETSPCPRKKSMATTETDITDTDTMPFASIFDSFSVPAFFILLEDLLQSNETDDVIQSSADLDLLRKISACYSLNTGRMQSNSYHRKVSWIFDQLLTMIDILKGGRHPRSNSVPPPLPVAEMIPPSYQPQMMDFSNASMMPAQGDMSSFSPTPSGNTSLSWDNWLTISSALGSNTPFGATNLADIPGTHPPDLLAQMLSTSHSLPDSSVNPMQWPTSAPWSSSARKRPRTHDQSDDQAEENDLSPMSEFLISGLMS